MQSLVITSGECLQSGTLADGQCAFLGVGEEVIALVVNDDEGGEVFYLNLPYLSLLHISERAGKADRL